MKVRDEGLHIILGRACRFLVWQEAHDAIGYYYHPVRSPHDDVSFEVAIPTEQIRRALHSACNPNP